MNTRAWLALMVALVGCDAPTTPPEPDAPAAQAHDPSPAVPEKAHEPTEASEPTDRGATPPTPLDAPTASLCERMCIARGQARAMSADFVARECAERCAGPAPEGCEAAAREARARIEAVPMRKRAAKVWAELAKPSFYCGHTDAFIRGLAAAATDDLDARSDALMRALKADPWATDTCPTMTPLDTQATATDAIAACGLSDEAAGWHDDVDAATFLANRAVTLRLQASKLHEGDRAIVLKTLLLSTAIVREK